MVVALGVGDQESEIGQSVEASGQSVGVTVQLGEGGRIEEGGRGSGNLEPTEEIRRRLIERQRGQEASGGQAVVEGRGEGSRASRDRRPEGARDRPGRWSRS